MTDKPVIDKFLHAIETANIPGCDAWSADATLDATVPNWRLHAVGADAIRAEYARWFADPARFDELRRYPVEGSSAEVVEYTLSWTENGVPHAGHHLHVLTVRDDRLHVQHGLLRRPLAGRAARRDGGGRCLTPWPSCSRVHSQNGPRWTRPPASREPGAGRDRRPGLRAQASRPGAGLDHAGLGCLRGAPLVLWERGILAALPRLPQPADRGCRRGAARLRPADA